MLEQEYDVIIVGGGTAGVMAALAAARMGARTIVVERCGFLGGTLTACEVHQIMTFHSSDGTQILRGIAQEFVEKLQGIGGSPGHCNEQQGHLMTATPFDPELAKYVLSRMLLESSVEILLHGYFSDTLASGRSVKGIVVESKSGRLEIEGKVTVDCTGDADVIARAGGEFVAESKKNLQPMSLILRIGNVDMDRMLEFMADNPDQFKFADDVDLETFKNTPYTMNCFARFKPWQRAISGGKLPDGLVIEQGWFASSGGGLKRGEINVNATRIANVDGTDAFDLSRAQLEAHHQAWSIYQFLKESFPGFEDSYILNTAPQIGVRETRRVVGEYTLTDDDILSARRFEDCIGLSASPIDIHQPDTEGEFTWRKTDFRGSAAYDIPYRILVPKDLDNVLVAGRAVSATHEAYGSTRLMGTCFATGHAAGVAAALSVKGAISPRDVNLEELKAALKRQGAVIRP
jgi:hypothetical protein